jgi:hypothetical protein
VVFLKVQALLFGLEEATGRGVPCELNAMSETEDYPGPSRDQPEKEGQEAPARTDEEMVKPPAKTEVEAKKDRVHSVEAVRLTTEYEMRAINISI